MKIRDIITESTKESPEQIANLLRQTPFFQYNKNELCNSDLALYHGRTGRASAASSLENSSFFRMDIKKREKPTDTNPLVSQYIDKITKKHFGVSLRSETLFVSNSKQEAILYGRVFYVFPVNDYTIFYNENVYDLTTDFQISSRGLARGFHQFLKTDLNTSSTKMSTKYGLKPNFSPMNKEDADISTMEKEGFQTLIFNRLIKLLIQLYREEAQNVGTIALPENALRSVKESFKDEIIFQMMGEEKYFEASENDIKQLANDMVNSYKKYIQHKLNEIEENYINGIKSTKTFKDFSKKSIEAMLYTDKVYLVDVNYFDDVISPFICN